MISQNWIDNLTNEEKTLLLGIVNILNKQPFNMEVDLHLVKFYKTHVVQQMIKASEDKIKEENLPFYSGLCQKFEVK